MAQYCFDCTKIMTGTRPITSKIVVARSCYRKRRKQLVEDAPRAGWLIVRQKPHENDRPVTTGHDYKMLGTSDCCSCRRQQPSHRALPTCRGAAGHPC